MKTQLSKQNVWGLALVCLILGSIVHLTYDTHQASKKEALSQLSQMCSAGLDYDYLMALQNPKFCLPIMPELFEKSFRLKELNQKFSELVLKSKQRPTEIFQLPFRLLSSNAGGFGPPLRGTQHKFEKHFLSLNAKGRQNFLTEAINLKLISSPEKWQQVPESFQNSFLELLFYVDMTNKIMLQFIQPIADELKKENPDFEKDFVSVLMQPWLQKQLFDFSVIDAAFKADMAKLSFANRLLHEKINFFIQAVKRQGIKEIGNCKFSSDWGDIGIYGHKNDTIEANYALLFDLSGDDLYEGEIATALNLKNPTSILIDLAGNDKYNAGKNNLAKAVLGLSALYDLSGDDYYYSEKPSMASSLFGASILYDKSGADTYASYSNYSQASAIFGAAVLLDVEGDDTYKSRNYSQAFASTKGVGLLIDLKGDDLYTSVEQEECSFVQGASKGRWAEATDGQNLSGGIGYLMDFSGNDKYLAKSFSQAASYYFGIGLLYDADGCDSYDAISHSQAYATHFALSNLLEVKGDDFYNKNADKQKITQIIGGGRDLSSGWFIDLAGDDEYHFGNRSAGIADMNGTGVLFDDGGDNSYYWYQNKIYKNSPSLGIEIDAGQQMMIDFRFLKPAPEFNQALHYDKNGDYTVQKIVQ